MKDIVERLEKEARNISTTRTCNCKTGLHFKDCEKCRQIKLIHEAAHEIEELRSLINAIKNNR